MSTYAEDHLVEQPAMQLMQHELGWEVVSCYGEWDAGTSNLRRDGKREVVLTGRLKPVNGVRVHSMGSDYTDSHTLKWGQITQITQITRIDIENGVCESV